ncbi:hypothetical protein MMC25_000228 [Agyrium rufum]|nr:hypothetical protein [Agyrium rufum]
MDDRLCSLLPGSNTTCCVPCPVTDWTYPDNFENLSSNVSGWINVGSLLCCAILLLSFLVLPAKKTHRHYLTICLIAASGMMSLAFIIPLASKPDQCYDAITPNDMFSDLKCAFSGSFLIFGGFAAVTWVLIRSLSLHLQICWQVIVGKRFFIFSMLAGWGLPAISLALSLSLTGVSYRFGNVCHINHAKSVGTFWGPILAFAILTFVIQFVTLTYCIRVYIRALLQQEGSSMETGSQMPSMQGSIRTAVTARAAYRRVKKVILLQWRGIAIVLIVIADVIFFSIIFLRLDNATQAGLRDPSIVEPWLLCLAFSGGNKNACLKQASRITIFNEATVMAVLYLLSLNGVWCLLFLGSPRMASAWIDIFRHPRTNKLEFVSRDANRLSDARNYEMLTSPPQAYQRHGSNSKGAISASSYGVESEDIDDDFKTPMSIHSQRTMSVSSERNDHFVASGELGNGNVYGSTNFSRPRAPSRSASDASNHGYSNGAKPAMRSPRLTSASPPPITSHDYQHVRLGSVTSISAAPQSRPLEHIGSPHRTGSALSYARQDSLRGNSALGSYSPPVATQTYGHHHAQGHMTQGSVGREWDPSQTYASPTTRAPGRRTSGSQPRTNSANGFAWPT